MTRQCVTLSQRIPNDDNRKRTEIPPADGAGSQFDCRRGGCSGGDGERLCCYPRGDGFLLDRFLSRRGR